MAPENEKGTKERPSGPFLAPQYFRSGLAVSFLLWGFILIVFFWTGKFTVWVKRDDLIGLSQTDAAVAAISLGILTYLNEMKPKDRLLKLVFTALTFVFLVGTIMGWLAALTTKPPVPQPSPPESDFTGLSLRFLVIGIVFVLAGIWGAVEVFWGRRRLEAAYDYSFFCSPVVVVGAFAFWPSDKSLAGITLALSLGGIAYLSCFVVVLFICLWRVKPYEEKIADQILDIVGIARAETLAGKREPALVKLEELAVLLHSNDKTLRRAIDNLLDEDRLLEVNYGAFYILEEQDSVRCDEAVLAFRVIVFGKDEEEQIAKWLAAKLRLPAELVDKYLVGRVRALLRERYTLAPGKPSDPIYFDPRIVTRENLDVIFNEGVTNDEEFGMKILEQFKPLPEQYFHYSIVGSTFRKYLAETAQ